MIMAWAVGSTVGALLAGSVADAIGDTAAYVVTAALLLLVVGPGATLDLRARRPA
jgi:predicted MFS family arabinose efflux permease